MPRHVPWIAVDALAGGVREEEHVGSVLFCDVRGFTTLTEAALRLGAPGVELVHELLDRVFEPLVAAVHVRGGIVTGFAGDSLTALFLGDAAGAATEAARAMAATAGGLAAVETSAGRFRFEVKCGVDHGAVRAGILRHTAHATWYVAGPAVDGARAQERRAGTGETACSASALVPAASGAPRVETQEGAAEEGLRAFTPAAVVETIARRELRHVAAAFLRVERTSEHGALELLYRDVCDLLAIHGGTFNKIEVQEGGAVVYVDFGSPRSLEKPELAAVGFVVALRARLPAAALRAGIDAGLVYSGLVGSAARSEWSCIGHPVNVAARLMTTAEAGEILATEAVARECRSFIFSARGARVLRGGARPVVVAAVAGRRPAAPAYARRMLGRGRELERLAAFLGPVTGGAPPGFAGVMHVVGDAGLGKSRLVAALREGVGEERLQWIALAGNPLDRTAFSALSAWLVSWLGISDGTPLPERERAIRALVPVALAEGAPEATVEERERIAGVVAELVDCPWDDLSRTLVEPAQRRRIRIDAVKALVVALARRRPLVLVLDDAMWLDDASAEWLSVLTRNVEDVPFAVLAASRPAEDGSAPPLALARGCTAVELWLAPISGEAFVHDMALSVLGGDVEPGVAGLVGARAAGNPLFTEQLLLHLSESGALLGGAVAPGVEMAMPSTLQSLITARIDRLAPDVRETVKHASVLGLRFLARVLAQLLDRAELLPRSAQELLDASERSGIVTHDMGADLAEEDAYLFRHVLMRDAAYGLHLPSVRARLHGMALDIIESVFPDDLPRHASELAEHARAAAALGDEGGRFEERERRYLRIAARRALDVFDQREAIRSLDRLAALAGTTDAERAADLRSSGMVTFQIGRPAEAITRLRRSAELAREVGDAATEVEALVDLGTVMIHTGRPAESREVLLQAIALAERHGSPYLRARAVSRLGGLELETRPGPEAERLLREGLALLRQEEHPRLEGVILGNLASLLVNLGRFAEGEALYEEALAIARRIGDRLGEMMRVGNLAIHWILEGRVDEAAEGLARALAMSRALGIKNREGIWLANLVGIEVDRGNLDRAWDRIAEVEAVARENEDQRLLALASGQRGNVCRDRGDVAAAEGHHDRAREISHAIADLRMEGKWLLALAGDRRDLRGEGRPELEEALRVVREGGDRVEEAKALDLSAEWRREDGDGESCLRDHDAAVAISESISGARDLAQQLARRGTSRLLFGDLAGATADLARAAEIFSSRGGALDRVRDPDLLALRIALAEDPAGADVEARVARMEREGGGAERLESSRASESYAQARALRDEVTAARVEGRAPRFLRGFLRDELPVALRATLDAADAPRP